MPAAYGVSHGNRQSLRHRYNPLRGNNALNHNDYSSLHYQSTHNRHHAPQPTPGNPSTYNPYLSLINATEQKTHSANNRVSNPPDLSKTRLPPQTIATPPRTNHRSTLTQQTEQEQEDATTGWDFTVFGLLKSAWCKLVGTPSKKTTSNKRESMSQPPQSPLHDQPSNPSRITSTIPENRAVTAPISRATHAPLVDEMATIHVTPPQQTRPNPHTYLSQTSSNTATTDSNDDAKSHNTSGKTDGGSTAVISIHNLLQKTKLSPDDAAWLHSKIDQVTHDRYDGSLSYIGPTIRAGSQELIQQMSFDDNFRNRYHKKGNGVIHSRKRGRDELEEDEQMMESQHTQRKRMKFTRPKPARDIYLRPFAPGTKSTPNARSPLKQPEQPSAAQRNEFHFETHENTNNKEMNPSQNVTRVGMVTTVVNDHASLSGNVEYDGSKHDPMQSKDEVETRDKKTPDPLSKTLNDKKEDKKEEKKSELFPGFKFVAPSATSDAKVNKEDPLKEEKTPKTTPFAWGVAHPSLTVPDTNKFEFNYGTPRQYDKISQFLSMTPPTLTSSGTFARGTGGCDWMTSSEIYPASKQKQEATTGYFNNIFTFFWSLFTEIN